MMFPRFLLDLDIPETSKILYMVLLDRARLSQQNDGWIDENGNIFLFYTLSNLSEELHKSVTTIKNSLLLLEQHDLISRKQLRKGTSSRIYVKLKTEEVADRNLAIPETENGLCGRQKTDHDVGRKLATNKNYITNKKITRNTNYHYECKEDESL